MRQYLFIQHTSEERICSSPILFEQWEDREEYIVFIRHSPFLLQHSIPRRFGERWSTPSLTPTEPLPPPVSLALMTPFLYKVQMITPFEPPENRCKLCMRAGC
ncbi:hypothetical protein CDAR_296821 [Caerostris darwini]|uniref:Uncharacterized protein n=1 Tax=Caerostris darwini TaxID=1538125 RepID=A0AAV4N6U7_9ARAC|nr:hypothetical protein CDAR_296821 [Caerostris darwini]